MGGKETPFAETEEKLPSKKGRFLEFRKRLPGNEERFVENEETLAPGEEIFPGKEEMSPFREEVLEFWGHCGVCFWSRLDRPGLSCCIYWLGLHFLLKFDDFQVNNYLSLKTFGIGNQLFVFTVNHQAHFFGQ